MKEQAKKIPGFTGYNGTPKKAATVNTPTAALKPVAPKAETKPPDPPKKKSLLDSVRKPKDEPMTHKEVKYAKLSKPDADGNLFKAAYGGETLLSRTERGIKTEISKAVKKNGV